MKVNGVDIRRYGAVQLTAEVLPSSVYVDYEIVTGAALPNEFETDLELGELQLCLYFRGENRSGIIRNMSKLLEHVKQSCDLEVDGYKGTFRGYCSGSSYEKMKVKDRYKMNLTFKGYFYDDEICLEIDGKTSAYIERIGSRSAPAIIEVTAKEPLKDFKITGFEDEITIEQLRYDETIIIDGENGMITKDTENAFDYVEMWSFPQMQSVMNLTFSSDKANVKIRYKPMWI